MDLVADFFPALELAVRGQPSLFDQLHATMERQPRHHFRMGEMFAAAAHFPDSFVWFLPM
jgi:hypothetical protein